MKTYVKVGYFASIAAILAGVAYGSHLLLNAPSPDQARFAVGLLSGCGTGGICLVISGAVIALQMHHDEREHRD